MAINTDMSKDFYSRVTLQDGFDHHWTQLMIECISSVQ